MLTSHTSVLHYAHCVPLLCKPALLTVRQRHALKAILRLQVDECLHSPPSENSSSTVAALTHRLSGVNMDDLLDLSALDLAPASTQLVAAAPAPEATAFPLALAPADLARSRDIAAARMQWHCGRSV